MVQVNIDIVYLIVVVASILISMTLHEIMHGLVGYWLGDDTAKHQGRLSLNPIRHVDPFLTIILPLVLALAGLPIFGGAKPVQINPFNLKWGEWGMALVAVAGPLTNLLIAFFTFGFWVLFGAPTTGVGAMFLTTMVQVNLGFFIFNMIPLPPLDGSRILYALAPDFIRKAMMLIERFGLIAVFILVLLMGPFLGTIIGQTMQFFIQLFITIFGG